MLFVLVMMVVPSVKMHHNVGVGNSIVDLMA